MSSIPVRAWLARDTARFGGLLTWCLFRALPATLLVALSLLTLSMTSASASDDTLRPEAVEGGQLLLRAEGGQTYTPALIHRSKVHFDISGMIATVVLEQSFRNDSDRWLEGVYAFPLPGTAAVRRMEMEIGERRIVGKIREREEARQIYRAARESGRKASLVEQQRPNLFTNRVANIGPGEEITVVLEYVQVVDLEGDAFSLRFPMTITPRYMPGAPLAQPEEEDQTLALEPHLGWARPTDQVPDAHAISPVLDPREGSDLGPNNPVEISARLDMGMPLAAVESPYHRIAMARRAGVYDIRLAGGVSEMDRDFVLAWRPVRGAEPSGAFFTEQVEGDYFGLLLLVPPAAERAGTPSPREIIFVVDTSGSMGGVSIEQARASVHRALQSLGPQDRFNIIAFNSGYHALYRTPVPASRHHLQRAQEFVRQLSASGGTEMMPALQAALASPGDPDLYRDQPPLRQVIFITDGAVGNEVALFEEIARRLGASRLFTVGIGSAPNSWFMRKAAEFGRGSHTHIGNLEEVGEKMDRLFDQLSRPAAIDLAIEWPGAVEVWPQRLPDLYLGQPLLVAARFGDTPPQGEVRLRGSTGGRQWQQTLAVFTGADPEAATQHRGVASVWARKKITGLLDEKVAGKDASEIREEVLAVALAHQLVSPYTSFVAVEEVVSRPGEEGMDSRAVANSRPRGQSPQTFAYPRGATTAPLQVWCGTLLLFVALMLRVMRRGDEDCVPTARA